MTELINKWKVVDMLTDLENEFQHYKPFHGFEHAMYRKVVEVEMEIGKMVAVEAEPVIHAHWIIEKRHSVSKNPYMDDNYHAQATCSHCGFVVDSRNMSFGYADLKTTKFCSDCGAHMDEEVDDA